MSLTIFRRFAIRAMKMKTPTPCFIRQQPISESFEVFESASEKKSRKRKFLKQNTFARRNNVDQLKIHRSITEAPELVDIRKIFSDESENVTVSTDHDLVNYDEEDSEDGQKTPVPHLIAKSAAVSAFQSKLSSCHTTSFQYFPEDWKKFQLEACSENPGLQKSWGTLCMQLMYQFGCTDQAASLLKYLNMEASTRPNISTLALYIALQGEYGGEGKDQVIQETFRKVIDISDVFDGITAKYLISGLAMTSQWQKTLDILEMVKLTMTPGTAYYSPIIAAAIREDKFDVAFDLLDELALKGLEPQVRVLTQILQECEKVGNHDLLEKYFSCSWKYNWLLTHDAAKQVELYYTKSSPVQKWSCKWTTVNTISGVCLGCKQGLDRIELASSDFEALQREFLERTLVGSNVYLKTNPEELERFQDFIMEHAPFDVVLDALNIALKGCGKYGMNRASQLRAIVHYFAHERHMKVLVIGRAHMKKWSTRDMTYISRNAKVFFTDNMSSDDPFCLYATLYSGRDCLFVSSDFMRDHKYNLGPGFRDIFENWQKSRQIVNFEANVDGVQVKMPSQYDCGPVKDSRGWHIPYNDGQSDLRSSSQSVLCLRSRGKHQPPRYNRRGHTSS